MRMLPTRKTAVLTEREQRLRREALAAAARSGVMEGLPPVSDDARAAAERYATGELTADQAVAEVLAPYRKGR